MSVFIVLLSDIHEGTLEYFDCFLSLPEAKEYAKNLEYAYGPEIYLPGEKIPRKNEDKHTLYRIIIEEKAFS